MSDEQRSVGPPMLVLTDALKSPKVRIGHIGGNFTLPRTVPLVALLAAVGGALFGVAVGFFIIGGVQATLYGAVLMGAAGWFVVTWSPLKGESMGMWLGLQATSRRKRLTLNGEPVQLAVGIARLGEINTGDVRVVSGAVTIPPSQYDERGVPVNAEDIFHRLLSLRGIPAVTPAPGPAGISIHDAVGGRGALAAHEALATHRALVESSLGTSELAKGPKKIRKNPRRYEAPVEEPVLANEGYEYPDYDLADDEDILLVAQGGLAAPSGPMPSQPRETISDWIVAPEPAKRPGETQEGGWVSPAD